MEINKSAREEYPIMESFEFGLPIKNGNIIIDIVANNPKRPKRML